MKISVLCIALLTFLALAGNAVGDTPEFDGVYAQLKNGEFVPLTPIEPSLILFSSRGDDSKLMDTKFFTTVVRTPVGLSRANPRPEYMICLAVYGFNSNQINYAESVDLTEVDAIVVRSPVLHELNGIAYLTTFDAVQSALRERQGPQALPNPTRFHPETIHMQNCQGRPGDHLNSSDGRPEWVRHSQGWGNWRTQTVDNLVTRFVPAQEISPPTQVPDFLGEPGKWPSVGFVVSMNIQGSHQDFFLGINIASESQGSDAVVSEPEPSVPTSSQSEDVSPTIPAVDDIAQRLLSDLLTTVEGSVTNVGETGVLYIQFERQFGVQEGTTLELTRQVDLIQREGQVPAHEKESIGTIEIFRMFNDRALAHAIGSVDVRVGDQVHLTHGELKHVIVTPFSQQQEITPFSLELQEKLSTMLVREGIQVIDVSRLERVLKDRGLSFLDLHDFELAKEVGELLGVQALVLGTLDEEDGQVIVSAQLLDIGAADTLLSSSKEPLPSFQADQRSHDTLASSNALFGPHAVLGTEDGYRCLYGPSTEFLECLREVGASVAAIRAAQELSSQGSNVVLSEYVEIGSIDVAIISFPQAGVGETIGMVRDGTNFLPAGGFFDPKDVNDRASQILRQRFPQSAAINQPGIFSHRFLADGGQRFVLSSPITDGCRACNVVATAIGYVDFQNDEVVDSGTIGWVSMSGDQEEVRRRLYAGDVRELQTQLNLRGYIAGSMDGAYGSSTARALREFRGEHCLGDDAEWTRETADLLVPLQGSIAETLRPTAECGPRPSTPLFAQQDDATDAFPLREGVYARSAEYCRLEDFDPFDYGDAIGSVRRVFEDDTMHYYESECHVDEAVERNGRIRVRYTCSGEGDTWSDDALFENVSETSFTEVIENQPFLHEAADFVFSEIRGNVGYQTFHHCDVLTGQAEHMAGVLGRSLYDKFQYDVSNFANATRSEKISYAYTIATAAKQIISAADATAWLYWLREMRYILEPETVSTLQTLNIANLDAAALSLFNQLLGDAFIDLIFDSSPWPDEVGNISLRHIARLSLDVGATVGASALTGATGPAAPIFYALGKFSEINKQMENTRNAFDAIVTAEMQQSELMLQRLRLGLIDDSDIFLYSKSQAQLSMQLRNVTAKAWGVRTGIGEYYPRSSADHVWVIQQVMRIKTDELLGRDPSVNINELKQLIESLDQNPINPFREIIGWSPNYAEFSADVAERFNVETILSRAVDTLQRHGTTETSHGEAVLDLDRPVNPASLTSTVPGSLLDCRFEDLTWHECWTREGASEAVLHLGALLEAEEYLPSPGVAYDFYHFGEVDVANVDFPYALPAGSPIEYFPMVNGIRNFVWPQPIIRRELETGHFDDPVLQRINNRHSGLTLIREPRFVGYRDFPDGRQRFVYNHALDRAPAPRNTVGSALAHFDFRGGRLETVRIRGAVQNRPRSGSIAEIQRELARRGYDAGPVDGQMGPRTRGALREFQTEHCLESTGQIDTATRRMITAETEYFVGGRERPVIQPCGPQTGVDRLGSRQMIEQEDTIDELRSSISSFRERVPSHRRFQEFVADIYTVYTASKNIRNLQSANALFLSSLTPEIAAQAELARAQQGAGLFLAGYITKFLVKDIYARAASDPSSAPRIVRVVPEAVALASIDAAFNLSGAVVTGGASVIVGQTISTTTNIVDAVIAYLDLDRETDKLVALTMQQTVTALRHYVAGDVPQEIVLRQLETTDIIAQEILSGWVTWAPSVDAAHRLAIIAGLGRIKVLEGEPPLLPQSVLGTSKLRDRIFRMRGRYCFTCTPEWNQRYLIFADQVARELALRGWVPIASPELLDTHEEKMRSGWEGAAVVFPDDSHGGVTFGSHSKISVGSTTLFQERLLGISNFDYLLSPVRL